MCGIVGAVAQRDIALILLDGLKRLEYRGYDSAGIATVVAGNHIDRLRTCGKVHELETALQKHSLVGKTGIAHTRWATHGKPSESNAHPHMSGDQVALVHNGIIENHDSLRQRLLAAGYRLDSETDTEVVAHMIHQKLQGDHDLLQSVQSTVALLEGAYALGIVHAKEPDRLIGVCNGAPMVIGLGIEENFIASDSYALASLAERIIYMEKGDIVDLRRDSYTVYDAQGQVVNRKIHTVKRNNDMTNKGNYRHYMQKEIFEQAAAVSATLEARLGKAHVLAQVFGERAEDVLKRIQEVHIVACGTSYHAGLVARYWIESIAGIGCQVEIASEFRYRTKVVRPGTLFVSISQSGETADTLAALCQARELEYEGTLAICNVPESSIVRESDLVFMTRAGIEIGVASTKAFTTQLTGLIMLTAVLAQHRQISTAHLVEQLNNLPRLLAEVLTLDQSIQALAQRFVSKQHTLFLGRGEEFPIAAEGALKLKELSYIHAEAYPAGELKHGPLALVDKNMLVVALAPHNHYLEKLKSNLHEVRARQGELIVFADPRAGFVSEDGISVITMPEVDSLIAPIIYTIPLQLLAYHVAVLKGTDVDQPRNLAKSVTVE